MRFGEVRTSVERGLESMTSQLQVSMNAADLTLTCRKDVTSQPQVSIYIADWTLTCRKHITSQPQVSKYNADLTLTGRKYSTRQSKSAYVFHCVVHRYGLALGPGPGPNGVKLT